MGRFFAQRTPGFVVVDIGDDLDIASAGDLEDVLASSRRGRRSQPVIVDLTSCRFIDCAGLAVLVRSHRNARLTVVLPLGHALRRIFAVTELDRVLTLVASRDVAFERAQTATPE